MEGETSGMNGVGESAMTQSMMATPSPSLVEDKPPPDLMTTSMHSLSDGPAKKGMVKRPQSHRNDTSQQWFLFSDENEGRTDMSTSAKEREEKVRRLRESQEEERKKKLEELKAHALNSQKFREQQENERRRHIEDLRSKDQERRCQVEERRKEIEKAENERREALLLRNKEREERITSQRKNSRSHIDFAFGSSAPRLLEPRIDSGYWGSRSPGDRNSAEREIDLRNKRTVSAQGLDRSTEGDEDGLVGGFQSTAHRRRTDLVPTIVMPRGEWSGSRSNTPSKMRSPGISRENTSTVSRPGSAMSGGSGPPRPVRLRSAPSRRPRPTSIATTGMSGSVASNGMTASMYEERQRPQAHVPRQKSLGSGTPKVDRLKRARSVTSDAGADEDARSTTSSVGPANRTPARKTPSQVKAEAAARKLKATRSEGGAKSEPSTPKSEASTPKSTKSEPSTPRKSKSEPTTPKAPKTQPSAPKTCKEEHTTFRISKPEPAIPKTPKEQAASEVHKPKTSKPDRKILASEGSPSKTPKSERKNINSDPSTQKTPKLTRKVDHKPPTPAKANSPKSSSRVVSVEKEEKTQTAEDKGNSEIEGVIQDKTVKENNECNLETGTDQDAENQIEDKKREENKNEKLEEQENAKETNGKIGELTEAEHVKATQAAPSTPKTSLGQKDAAIKKFTNSKSPSPSLSTENVAKGAGDAQENNRLTTPDIIRNNHKEMDNKDEKETTPEADGDKEQKNIISSEEEAKARIALKRKEMKEKKEREEELERQRQLELDRIEEERRLKEEEEERKMMEEADRMAVNARRAEEERIEKAIEEAEQEKRRQEEEEERLKMEKEEIERKTREEAEKREVELQEKLKKEEEERLARKKRIEEIMARTRGKGATPNTTPKKEVEPPSSPASQPASLDTNVDPTKPDLLGDINHDNVAAENAKNIEVSANVGSAHNGFVEGSKNGEAEVEKGTLDSLSKADLASGDFITKPVIHGMDLEKSKPRSPSPLNDAEGHTKKSGPAVTEGSQFDQLIDLGAMADTNKAEMPDHQPIMAFEDSIPSPRQQQNTAELLS